MFYDKEYLYKDMDSLIKTNTITEGKLQRRIINNFHMSLIMYKTKLFEKQKL